jgi:putative transposase
MSRRVLSWRLSSRIDGSQTLEKALAHHDRPDIFNTGQGSWFTGSAFTGVFANNGIAVGMDRKGVWRDYVLVGSLWRSVKCEEMYPFALQLNSGDRTTGLNFSRSL